MKMNKKTNIFDIQHSFLSRIKKSKLQISTPQSRLNERNRQMLVKKMALTFLTISLGMGSLHVYAEEWKTHQSKQGYSIDYPSHWLIDESEFESFVLPDKSAGVLIMIPSTTEIFGSSRLKDFVKTILRDLPSAQKRKTKLAGREAYVLSYSNRKLGTKEIYRYQEYIFLEYRYYYRLIYTASEKSFDTHLAVAKKMMDSFKPVPKDIVDKEEKQAQERLRQVEERSKAFLEEDRKSNLKSLEWLKKGLSQYDSTFKFVEGDFDLPLLLEELKASGSAANALVLEEAGLNAEELSSMPRSFFVKVFNQILNRYHLYQQVAAQIDVSKLSKVCREVLIPAQSEIGGLSVLQMYHLNRRLLEQIYPKGITRKVQVI